MIRTLAARYGKLIGGNGGMTLVEVMAAMCAAVFLMLAAGSLLLLSQKMFLRTVNKADTRQIASYVEHYLKEQFTAAEELSITFDPPAEEEKGTVICFTADGRLLKDGEELYGGFFYGGRKVEILVIPHVEENKKDLFDAVFTVKDRENETLYSEDLILRLINLRKDTNGIQYQQAGSFSMDSGEKDLYFFYAAADGEEGGFTER